MMSETYDKLRQMDWSHDEAKWRAGHIDRAKAAMRTTVASNGLADGDHVAVEFRGSSDHEFSIVDGVVLDGMMTVDGCVPSSGMVGRVMSRPYRFHRSPQWRLVTGGNDLCTLDNGDVLTKINVNGSTYWTADGERVSLAEHAAKVTPVT